MTEENALKTNPTGGYHEQVPNNVPNYPHLSEPQETPAQHHVERTVGVEIRPMPRVPNPYDKFGAMMRVIPQRPLPKALRMNTPPPTLIKTTRNPVDIRPRNRHCDPFAGLTNPCGIRKPMPKGMALFPKQKKRKWF